MLFEPRKGLAIIVRPDLKPASLIVAAYDCPGYLCEAINQNVDPVLSLKRAVAGVGVRDFSGQGVQVGTCSSVTSKNPSLPLNGTNGIGFAFANWNP